MRFAVGTYTSLGGPGIALCETDGASLHLISSLDAIADPIWLLPAKDGRTLYAAAEDRADHRGMAAAFALDGDALTLTDARPSLGAACCHLALDEARGVLYAANYVDASVAVLPIAAGRVMPAIQRVALFGSGPVKRRQAEAHAHQITLRPETDELFVCDLGADRVAVFTRRADGTLLEAGAIPALPGSGPRHLLFAGRDAFYLAGEVDSSVSYFRIENGAWKRVQTLSTLPEDCADREQNTASAIRMDAHTVYVSNRGHDGIAAFDFAADGTLLAPRFIPVPGHCPRDFVLTENGFLVAHQLSGGVALIDRAGQTLASLPISGAVCICPLE